MTLGDLILVALSVAGGIALGDAAKIFLAPAIDWLSKRSIESHKFALELRKIGYARVLDRYEACRTILAEVTADEKNIGEFVSRTPWNDIKLGIEADDRYAPLFLLDDTKSQLDRTLENNAHLLPAVIIDQAIEYQSARAISEVVTRAVMTAEFKLYETARKLNMIDWAKDNASEQLALAPRFKKTLEETCAALAVALKLDADGGRT